MQHSDPTQEMVAFAQRIALEAMALLSRLQQGASVAVRKDIGDFAMTADLESEKLLLSRIRETYPTHGILTEESGQVRQTSEYTWVIDPLDGTKDYARGAEDYGLLVGIEKNGQVLGGCTIVYANAMSVYTGLKSKFARYNGNQTKVSDQIDVRASTISFHIPSSKRSAQEKDRAFATLRDLVEASYRVRVNYNEARALGWVGRGLLDAHIIPPNLTKWWDLAPQLVFVEQSGGMVTDFSGNPIRNRDLSKGVVASNGKIHLELLDIINIKS
jgi:myo-inositol-1(or 4)-monophosphatase